MHLCTFIHLFFIIAKVWVSFQDPIGNQNMQAPHLILHPSPQNKIEKLSLNTCCITLLLLALNNK